MPKPEPFPEARSDLAYRLRCTRCRELQRGAVQMHARIDVERINESDLTTMLGLSCEECGGGELRIEAGEGVHTLH